MASGPNLTNGRIYWQSRKCSHGCDILIRGYGILRRCFRLDETGINYEPSDLRLSLER
jgi:hypothetical protein